MEALTIINCKFIINAAESPMLSITADGFIVELYVDGKSVDFTQSHWSTVREIPLPSDTKTIALRCTESNVSQNL